MNQHQSQLHDCQQKLRKEILSNNPVDGTLLLLRDGLMRSDRDRLDIYNCVLSGIGRCQHYWRTDPANSILDKFHSILQKFDDPLFHFSVVTNSTYYPVSFLDVFDKVNIALLDKEYHDCIIQSLLRNSYDPLRSNKNMIFLFKNYTLLKSAAQPHRHHIAQLAAQSAHTELLNALDWIPSNPTQENNFFISCCIGGLLNFIENINVSKTSVLHEGLLISLRRGHHHVVEHLCQRPIEWDKAPTFEALLYVDNTLFNVLVQHYKTHRNFDALICEVGMLNLRNNLGAFHNIVSHIPVGAASNMIGVAAVLRKKRHIKLLLDHVGDQGFNRGLENLAPKHVQWAQNYRAQLQQRVLKQEVKSEPVAARKSKM